MDFGVLGVLSVTDGGHPLALGGPVQRRLLAALIAHAPQPVSAEMLVDDVWGESAPATAVRTLRSHIARLRDALGRDSANAIETVDGRYRLSLTRHDLDAWVFEGIVRAATSLDSSPGEKSTALRSALALWRGSAYADFRGAGFADTEGRRLEALRDQAIDDLVQADLDDGKGAELVPELEALVTEHPFRERLWSALVVALYRAGRQGEALEAYHRARAVLGEELGVDPGPELTAVEARVLAQDPSLLAAAPTRTLMCPWKGLAAYEPGDAAFFVGRDGVVNEVIARLVDYSVVIVTGPSGSGKSSLVRAGVVPALADGVIIGSADWRVRIVTPGSRALESIRSVLSDAPDLLVIDPGDDLLTSNAGDGVAPVAELLRRAIAEGMRLIMTLRGDLFGRLSELNSLAPRAGAGTVLVGVPHDEELRQMVELPARSVGLDVEPALVDAVIGDVSGRPASLPLLSTALVRTWERRVDGRLTLAGYQAAGGTASALERLAEEAYSSMEADERLVARRLLMRLVVNDEGRWRRRRLPLFEAAPEGDPVAVRALNALSDHRLVSMDVEDVQLAHEALTSAWPRFAAWLAERGMASKVIDHLSAASHAWVASGRDDADLYRGARLQAAIDLASTQPDELGPTEREFIAASRVAADRELAHLRRGRRRLRYVAAGLVVLLVVASMAGAVAIRSRDQAARAAQEADAQRVGLQALTRTDVSQKLLLAVAAVSLHDNAGTQASLLTALQDAGASASTTVPLTAPATTLAVSSDGWIGVAEANGHIESFPADLGSPDDQEPAASWSQGTPSNVFAWLAGHESMLVGATDPDRVFSFNPQNGGVSSFAAGWQPTIFAATGDQTWAAGARGGSVSNLKPELLGQRVDDASVNVRIPLEAAPSALVPGPGTTVTVIERGFVQQVDVAKQQVLATSSVPASALVVASADGRHVAASSPDGTIELIDLRTRTSTHPIPTLSIPLSTMALSADGLLLAGAAPGDGVVRVWSTLNGVERGTFTSALGDVRAMAWAPVGSRLFTAPAEAAALQMWDLARFTSPAQPLTAAGPPGTGNTTATSVDTSTHTLAVATSSGRPWFMDLDAGTVHAATGGKRAPLVSVSIADHGRLALTADTGGVLTVWDPTTGQKVADLTRPTRITSQADIARAPVGPDGRTAASFIDGYGLQLVDVVSQTISRPVYPDLGTQSMFEALGWSPDGRYVVVGAQGVMVNPTSGTTAGVWALVDPHDGRVVWRTVAPEQVVAADVIFAESGRTIVVPGESGRMYFLDSATGRLMNPTGATAVRPPAVNERQTPASVSVSPDASRLSVVSEAHPVEIWDVAAGQQSATIQVPATTVAAQFLSDHELVTTTVGGAVTVHDLTVADWIELACNAADRELTKVEWNQFLPAYPYRELCLGNDRREASS